MWLSGLSGLVAYMVVMLSNVKIGKNTKNAFLMLIFLFLYFSCLDLLNYFACIFFFCHFIFHAQESCQTVVKRALFAIELLFYAASVG